MCSIIAAARPNCIFRRIGITFAVYGEADATERLIPFDVIPRIMSGAEWRLLEKGLTQRVKALNMFIKDVYGAREILSAPASCRKTWSSAIRPSGRR